MKLRLVLMLISDALLATAALSTAVVIRLGSEALRYAWLEGKALPATLIFVAVSLFSSYLMELYTLARGSSKWEIFLKSLQCGCGSFFLLSLAYYLRPASILGEGVFFISIAIFCFYQSFWHVLSTSGKYPTRFMKRVLILGCDKLAKELGDLVVTGNMFVLAGYLTYATDKETPMTECLNRTQLVDLQENLLATALKEKVDIIVVALPERRGILPLQEIMQCKLSGIEVLDAADFYEILQGKLMLEYITPNWIIFSTGFRRVALVSLLKRCIDIVLSLAFLVVSAPFLSLLALVIKLDSPGPLLFKDVRIGDSERPFVLYKFRTMTLDVEQQVVTRVGSLLRKMALDKIPQLYNVIKGEMSLIGPRPQRPEFVELLKKDICYYSKRHTIKPGITGWAEVRYPHGKTAKDAVEKLSYDLYYIKNLSASLDSQIMLEAVKVVLLGKARR
jgi:sugar transferase (PEP-CTERM system associated)